MKKFANEAKMFEIKKNLKALMMKVGGAFSLELIFSQVTLNMRMLSDVFA